MTRTFQVRVARRTVEAPDILCLELRPVNGGSLPPFTAGSHIEIETPSGRVRQYSLCNSPQETDRYVVGILRDANSRGGSESIHNAVTEGSLLNISEPRNDFPLIPGKRSLLLAGGIGITPMLSMAEELTRHGTAFELHYFARSRCQAGFLDRIAGSSFANSVHTHFDDESGQDRPDIKGLLSGPGVIDGAEVYVCGPSGFLEAIRRDASALGVATGQLHYELFGANGTADKAGDTFLVRLARSGGSYEIPRDRTITDVLAQNGVEIPISCEEGVCGTCITNVVSGEPDHRDSFFSEQEKTASTQIMPCCSRSKSAELVLDI